VDAAKTDVLADAATYTDSAIAGIEGGAGEVTQAELDTAVANASSALAAHEADTTSIHGISNTANLETTSGAQTKANTAQAYAIQRANHTGTQTSATVSDFVEAVEDAVAALIGRSTHTGITFTYTDASNTLAATVSAGLDAEQVRDTIGTALGGTGLITVTPNDGADTITISTSATANSSDATLLARANHTGTQSADTLTDGTTNKAFLATERTKLTGIATSATANDTDANLKARANHTGTQIASTISDFSTAADARISAAVGTSVQAYDADLTTWGGKTAPSGTVVGTTDAQTLTSKRVTKRVDSQTSLAGSPGTYTFDCDSYDHAKITAQAAALNIANPTGTPTGMQAFILRLKDNGTARALTYGSQFRAIGVTMPTTTVISKTMYFAFMWNDTDTKWDCVAIAQEA
jgi:hypothetical protein